ncbi:glucosyltransferase [Schizopora paradoxa]|uniref:Dol-P-Glc:Glc(2)Man(9)GlcNAc(2)-PP-Dol alpha-1,2-glucosyltransferase n=1 Tax=Schizopora paradoxa TaxID=27342 RepID=A0A0H2S9I8_9AGAM|nr:glucosyltransferase [Schizopora paradoxa]
MSVSLLYVAFCAANVMLLKEVNMEVAEPYMDEPFHVPQAQAYCRGEWTTWDPKITTPPGLYLLSQVTYRLFVFKCNLSVLRLTPLLCLLALPLAITRLVAYHKRERPPRDILSPSADSVVLALFPIAWFFGFMYYTDVPSLLFVVATVVAALQERHALSALLGLVSCTFRQTNIIWLLYAFAYSRVTYLRFRRSPPNSKELPKLHDPPALLASVSDIPRIISSVFGVIPDILAQAAPYTLVFFLFGGFVFWNGGIVLGDKSNHVPALHVPQVYYFVGFATLFGWPALISGPGAVALAKGVRSRMFGSPSRTAISIVLSTAIGVTVHLFTIHHPFLLSDNRHYTFYVWRRVFLLHPVVPYLLAPAYLACAWTWFLRVGESQTLLQTLVLPICALPTLLLTPLLEPRYFLIPYILLRAQIADVQMPMLALEGLWYAVINAATMYVYLYCEREGVGRFMW